MLVDPQFAKPTIKDNVLSKLDMEINRILNNKEDGDDVKAKKYMDVLQRYKSYESESKPVVRNIDNLEDDVLKSTPQNSQFKAKRLLTQLRKDVDINFTPEGQLIYKQLPIDSSNIIDLISDILQNKPSTIPGTKELAESLKETKTNKDLVSNPTVAKLMQPGKSKKPLTEEKPASIAKAPTPSKASAVKRQRKSKLAWEEY